MAGILTTERRTWTHHSTTNVTKYRKYYPSAYPSFLMFRQFQNISLLGWVNVRRCDLPVDTVPHVHKQCNTPIEHDNFDNVNTSPNNDLF